MYRIRLVDTQKNHLTTLVLLSTPGKRCDRLASSIPDDARDHFRWRLTELSGECRTRDYSPAGPSTWRAILDAHADQQRLSSLSDRDRLIVDSWLIMGGDDFPPTHRHFGRVRVYKSKPRQPDPASDYLVFDGASAALHLVGMPERRLPDNLASRVRGDLDSARPWRPWLFQSRNGTQRPVADNAFGMQVKGAFMALCGSAMGINALLAAYQRHKLETP